MTNPYTPTDYGETPVRDRNVGTAPARVPSRSYRKTSARSSMGRPNSEPRANSCMSSPETEATTV